MTNHQQEEHRVGERTTAGGESAREITIAAALLKRVFWYKWYLEGDVPNSDSSLNNNAEIKIWHVTILIQGNAIYVVIL